MRLATFHSFCRYLQLEFPDYIHQAQQFLAIPIKRTKKISVEYLTLDAMKFLLEKPDNRTREGRRDTVLLSLLYESGARVQELADLKVGDIRTSFPPTVKLTGKGDKRRIVPLMEPMGELLKQYLKENNLTEPYAFDYPLFSNRSKDKLTRAGSLTLSRNTLMKQLRKLLNCFRINVHLMVFATAKPCICCSPG